MEHTLNLLSAIITLLSTALGVLKDQHSEKKAIEKIQVQQQNQELHHISTNGDHSNININAQQNQYAYDLSPREYEKALQEDFAENFSANRFALKGVWGIAIILSIFLSIKLFPTEEISLIILNTVTILIVILFSISLSMFILRIFQQFKSKSRYAVHEKSSLATCIRYTQFYLAPLLAFITQFFIFQFLAKNFVWVQKNYHTIQVSIFIIYFVILAISFYLCNYLIYLILFYNMQQISFKKQGGKRLLHVPKKIGYILIIFIVLAFLYFQPISDFSVLSPLLESIKGKLLQ